MWHMPSLMSLDLSSSETQHSLTGYMAVSFSDSLKVTCIGPQSGFISDLLFQDFLSLHCDWLDGTLTSILLFGFKLNASS